MRRLMIAGLALASLAGTGAAALATSSAAQTVVVERYGHWDPTWGEAPPPPMHRWRHWRGEYAHNWYPHVHSCMVKYHTYDPRRDMYLEGRRWVPCHDED